MQTTPTAILFLEDGRFFTGLSFGTEGERSGEVCFNTGMTGYQEILTDPSYRRQLVTMTSVHIGNYGVNPDDVESTRIQVGGFIVREETVTPSNWRSEMSIGDYLRSNEIVGIKGIDTRALTRHIRDNGAMNGIISTTDTDLESLKKKIAAIPSMTGLDLAAEVTCSEPYAWESAKGAKFKVAAVDFGIKWNILRLLASHGCDVTVFPASVTADQLRDFGPDGLFLSNGPGDPAAVIYAIDTVKSLLGEVPIFGICLGHQILALALGAKTFKLKFGHRGLNHPVRYAANQVVEITSQNHGFAVDAESLPTGVDATHVNLNDNTLEGIRCRAKLAFSVQYHPESSPGPHDSRYLFEEFTRLMESRK
jgi:carbamoyl-phosphate synthase small subunit